MVTLLSKAIEEMNNKEQLRRALHNSLDLLFGKLEQQDKKLEKLRKESARISLNQINYL